MPKNESNNNGYKSPPKPVSLDAPGLVNPDDFELPRRRRYNNAPPSLPEIAEGGYEELDNYEDDHKDLHFYRAAQRSYGNDPPTTRPKPRRGRNIPASQRPPRRPPPPGMRKAKRRKHSSFHIDPKVKRITVVGIGAMAAVIIVILLWVQVTADNAFAVYLDGRFMGYIAITPEMDSTRFHNETIRQLELGRGADEVRVRESITLRPTRAAMSEQLTTIEMRARLNAPGGLTIELAVIDVFVNGQHEVTMRNMADALHLEHLLKQDFFNPPYTLNSEFVEEWELRTRFVPQDYDDFFTPTAAQFRLERPQTVLMPYVVQDGDNLHRIAARHDTTMNRILYYNSHVNAYGHIFPGEILQIHIDMPFLSVRTFDYISEIEIIPMPIETQYTAELPYLESRVIQEGRDGEQFARQRITRVNGVEVSRETLDADNIHEATPHIIQRGTG